MTTALATATEAFERGDYIDALTRLSSLLDSDRSVAVLALLGETFDKLGLRADAVELFAQAADLDPTPANLRRAARAAQAAGDEPRALLYGMKLYLLEPDDIDMAALLAETFLKKDDPASARLVRETLAKSDRPEHIRMAADLYLDESRSPIMLEVFAKRAALDPDNPLAQAKYMSVARDFCDYAALAKVERRCARPLLDKAAAMAWLREGETTFDNLHHCADERLNRLATNGAPPPFHLAPASRPRAKGKARGDRLRIGYLSNDFWSGHATMRLLKTVLELHDRSRFDVTLYCHTDEAFTRAETCDPARWGRVVSIRAMTDDEAARRIRADGIDILVDLKGLTAGTRSGILNRGVAPVQVAWLGFPGSAVNVDCDYIIGDRIVLPDSSAPHYHERFCRLPECYQPNDPVDRALPAAASRAALGLPEDRIVFASFNAQRKITPATLDLWQAVLHRVPDSILWVMIDMPLARENFLSAMAARGIGAQRIVLADRMRYEDHIARVQAADLGLDTVPCNGHTTTSDQLWAGLPVLTLKGTHFASRVSESLLTAIGLPDLVMPDAERFVARAAELAERPEALAAYRRTLVENRFRAPLFDAERFCRHLEQAFTLMADRARKGLKPVALDVPCLPPRSAPFRMPPAPAEPA